jgi:hypothetical protein
MSVTIGGFVLAQVIDPEIAQEIVNILREF